LIISNININTNVSTKGDVNMDERFKVVGKKACNTVHKIYSNVFGTIVHVMRFERNDGFNTIVYLIDINGEIIPSLEKDTVILEG
jgi:hypothetical protein